MTRKKISAALLGLIVCAGLAAPGCGSSKSDGVPNSALEVPNVPPGERSIRDPATRD